MAARPPTTGNTVGKTSTTNTNKPKLDATPKPPTITPSQPQKPTTPMPKPPGENKGLLSKDEIEDIKGLNPLKNVNGVFKMLSDISPILITGFLFMNTVFNYDLKAVFWIGPLLVWLMIIRATQSKLKENEIDKTSSCSKMFGMYKSPCLSSFFIMYTLGYIAAPMPIYNDWNVLAIMMFVALFTVDSYTKLSANCSTSSGVAIGGIGGLMVGVLMYFLFTWAGLGKFLYYKTGNTNNEYC